MMMPAISMARLEMIKVDTPATVTSVRLLRSLTATGRLLATGVLTLPPAPPAVPGRLSEGSDEDRLDRMQAVLGLVEHDASARIEYLAGDFETRGHAGVLHDLASHGGVRVMVRGQAVHELDGRVPAAFHQGGVDLIGLEHADPVRPNVLGLAHGHPHICVDAVAP